MNAHVHAPRAPLAHRFRLTTLVVVTVAATVALFVPGAEAGPGRVSAPRLVSGPDPLPPYSDPHHCGSAAGGPYDRHGWETEPSIGINPAGSDNIASAWSQAWNDAITVGYTTDGGESWSHVVPPTTICTPGGSSSYDASAFDPSLAFGASADTEDFGAGYLSSIAAGYLDPQDHDRGQHMAVLAHRTTNGGRSWSQPAVIDTAILPCAARVCAGNYLDTTNVVADPARPGRAYAGWTKGDVPFTMRHHYVSTTDDAGHTWSPPVRVPTSKPGTLVPAGTLLVLPDRHGTVLDIQTEVPTVGQVPGAMHGPTRLVATRSADSGAHWSQPVTIADPADDLHMIFAAGAAVAPDGTVYVSWIRMDPGQSSFHLWYAASTDSGQTWSAPAPVGPPVSGPPVSTSTNGSLGPTVALHPDVAVAKNGTIGIAFYDHRNDVPPSDPPQVTDYWIRYSTNAGETWSEDHIAGPFDVTTAPALDGTERGGRGEIGASSIAPIANGFATTFALAEPLPSANYVLSYPPTDIYYSRITPRR